MPADAEGGQVSIMCHFNQTSSTEVQVTPASTAQQSSTQPQNAAASAVDDLTDDFAAGDAAVQIPVCAHPLAGHVFGMTFDATLC